MSKTVSDIFSRIWEIGTYVALITFVIHVLSALTLDRIIEYRQVTYTSEKILPSLDGYLIAFITDTHSISMERLGQVIERLNGYDIDLLLLGGDFHLRDRDQLDRIMEAISKVQATDGIYGVEGNHDSHRSLFASMRRFGITPLSNNGYGIREGLHVGGIEDMWNRSPDVAMAVSDAQQDDFVLLVSHNPEIVMKQYTGNVDLILSGHTHGGHITLFGLWAPALHPIFPITEYGHRFKSGLIEFEDKADVFVSNGTWTYGHIPRIFARPQVILLTLTHG